MCVFFFGSIFHRIVGRVMHLGRSRRSSRRYRWSCTIRANSSCRSACSASSRYQQLALVSIIMQHWPLSSPCKFVVSWFFSFFFISIEQECCAFRTNYKSYRPSLSCPYSSSCACRACRTCRTSCACRTCRTTCALRALCALTSPPPLSVFPQQIENS